jgi:predicted Zn-dependent protease with MMP-like domain
VDSPSDPELEDLVLQALAELPREFRDRIANLAVVIEDEPPPGTHWLAVYQGTPLPQQSVFQGWSWPHKITIFRGPLRRLYGDDPQRFESEVRHVVRHEIAHYFGISDERLLEIDRY